MSPLPSRLASSTWQCGNVPPSKLKLLGPHTSRNLPGLTLSKTRGNRPLCFQMFKVRKYSTVVKIKVSNYKNLIVFATQLFRAWEPIKTERYIGWLNQLASPLCCCCLIKCFQHFNILTSVQFLRTINIPWHHEVQNRAAIYKVMAAPWGQWPREPQHSFP